MKDIMTSCLGHDGSGQLISIYNESHTDSPVFTCCTCVIQNSFLFWYWSWCFSERNSFSISEQTEINTKITTRKVTHYGSHIHGYLLQRLPLNITVLIQSGHSFVRASAALLSSLGFTFLPPIIHMFMLQLRDYTASCSFSFIKDRTGTGIRTSLSNSPR